MYELMWREHKLWIEAGLKYYTELLSNFEDMNSHEYAMMSGVVSSYENVLNQIESDEKYSKKITKGGGMYIE